MSFNPMFAITPETADSLMKIAALRENILALRPTPGVVKTLRDVARIQSAYWSTLLSGYAISLNEVERIARRHGNFSARDRGEREAEGYFAAMDWAENNADRPVAENTVRKINAISQGGDTSRVLPSPYRETNIKPAAGKAAKAPPETAEIPSSMRDLATWLGDTGMPSPLAAAMAHYGIASICPFADGNMRTARIAANLVLYRAGFGLNGFYSLEEQYGADIELYNSSAREGIDKWAQYFTSRMALAFELAKERAEREIASGASEKSAFSRSLSPRQRKILTLFADKDVIASKDVETMLGFSARSARLLCHKLVADGFLATANKADKTRTYKLAEKFRAI